ncbi:MAG: SDR family NAD(P)-dependent oxidoreductase [Bdellovibrionota bacterium]
MSAKPTSVALVTGAGRGIGQAAAMALAKAGMHVYLVSRTLSEIKGVESAIRESGGSAEGHRLRCRGSIGRCGCFCEDRTSMGTSGRAHQ